LHNETCHFIKGINRDTITFERVCDMSGLIFNIPIFYNIIIFDTFINALFNILYVIQYVSYLAISSLNFTIWMQGLNHNTTLIYEI